eukprot:TRINITY_DN29062_c0_g1_i1.p1 TRINITY_DN29062_c0_g1~~TRINITY_DN29062_c0_g1_i1.p1  ORF type:complete len:1260 (+),score=307.25 TRINITY_DN29062_c0_g1_i1:67-3846(+)
MGASVSCGPCKEVREDAHEEYGLEREFGDDAVVVQLGVLSKKKAEGAHAASFMDTEPEHEPMAFKDVHTKITQSGGVLALMDQYVSAALDKYDASTKHAEMDEAAAADKLHQYASRLTTCEHFATSFAAAFFSYDSLKRKVGDTPFLRSVKDKGVLPFITAPWKLGDEEEAVQVMTIVDEDQVYRQAVHAGVIGLRIVGVIKHYNTVGMQLLMQQQFEFVVKTWSKGLVPVLTIMVDIYAPDRDKIESALVSMFMEQLGLCCNGEQVIFILPVPKYANTFLPLTRHPNCMKVTGSTTTVTGPGFNRAVSCKLVANNLNVATCFGRALVEGLEADQSDEDFAAVFKEAIDAMVEASKPATASEEQRVKLSNQGGFLVYLEQNPAGLGQFGIDTSTPPEQIADRWNEFLARLMKAEAFSGNRILGAMINKHAMENLVIDEKPVAKYLWETKNLATVLTTESIGLKNEAKGVRLLKPFADMDKLLNLAVEHGMFAVCIKTIIAKPVEVGIKGVCRQQFDIAKQIIAKGLVPMVKIQVTAPSGPEKVACEKLLFNELMTQLGKLKHDEHVMLDLRVPDDANSYFPLMGHPNVLRVIAHSAGLGQEASCKLLAQNFNLVASFGNAFTEGLKPEHSDAEFNAVMDKSCAAIYQASTEVSVKELQAMKVSQSDGIFIPLDQGSDTYKKTLTSYMATCPEAKEDQAHEIQEMRLRLFKNPVINGAVVTMISIAEDLLDAFIEGKSIPKHLWEDKQVVPCLKIDSGLQAEKNGVRVMKVLPNLTSVLDKASEANVFGARMKATIKSLNEVGIKRLVQEQMALAEKVREKGLLPVMTAEVDKGAKEKGKIESALVTYFLDAMSVLRPTDKLVIWLTPPSSTNVYLPLISHPNVIRTVMSSGDLDTDGACDTLGKNIGMVAGFGSACVQNLRQDMSEEEYTSTLEASCKAMFDVSRSPAAKDLMMAKLADQKGYFVLLDQTASIPQVLRSYGSAFNESEGQEKMLQKMHEQNARIMSEPNFNGSHIIGAVLSADTTARRVKSSMTGRFLWDEQRIVPFMKIEQTLAPEENGVQLMKSTANISAELDKAITCGCAGVKIRGLVKAPNAEGIAYLMMQLLQVAQEIQDKGLVPLVQINVENLDEQEACEKVLRQQLVSKLRSLPEKVRIIFALTSPVKPDTYSALAAEKKALRVLAVSSPRMSGADAVNAFTKLKGSTPAYLGAIVKEGLMEKQLPPEFTSTVSNTLSLLSKASSDGKAAEAKASAVKAKTP